MRARIVSNKEIAKEIFSLWLEAEVKVKAEPGMYVMIGWEKNDPFLNRPFSIADLDGGRIRIIFNLRGRGTRLLAQSRPGDDLFLSGPWGNGLPDPEPMTLLVAGGIGIAPLFFYKRRYPQSHLLYGAKSREYLIDLDERVHYVTEDGSQGDQGLVTDFVDDVYDLVIACGPIAMLYELKQKVRKGKLWGLLEGRMGCGCGICMGCAIPTLKGYLRLCRDGPAFPLHEVDFEALRNRV